MTSPQGERQHVPGNRSFGVRPRQKRGFNLRIPPTAVLFGRGHPPTRKRAASEWKCMRSVYNKVLLDFFRFPLSNIDGIERAADPEGSLIGRTDVAKVGSRLHGGSRPSADSPSPIQGYHIRGSGMANISWSATGVPLAMRHTLPTSSWSCRWRTVSLFRNLI